MIPIAIDTAQRFHLIETEVEVIHLQLSRHRSTELPQEAAASLQLPSQRNFLIEDIASGIPQGFVLLKDYDRLQRSREIIAWVPEDEPAGVSLSEVLQAILGTARMDSAIEWLVLKIEEDRPDLISLVQALGFTREGVFISNQFLKGEFRFYSVFAIHL